MLRHIAFVVALFLAQFVHAHAARLEHFAPLGEQLEIRQTVARFSVPMAALGAADAAPPFNVECAVPGSGHWADERTWVYDLNATPPVGAPCRFSLKPGLTTLAGEKVEASDTLTIATAGPRLLASLPQAGARIDEDQIFVLLLNGPAHADSLVAHARCEAHGIHEQIPVVRLSGAERERMLRQLRDQLYELGENWADSAAGKDPRLEVLRCQRTLPANARFALVWGAGIATASGQRNPADQRLEFTVRDHFVAHLRCQRENAKAGCLPLTPIRVDFTAPVARELLDRITLKDSKGKIYPQEKSEQSPAMDDNLSFKGPFPASESLTLALPGKFVDDKERALVNAARFPLQVRIADLPPLVKFAGDFGIIERVAGGMLPITLRNLEPDPADPAGGTAAKVRWLRLSDDAGVLDWQGRLHQIDNPPYVQGAARQPDPRRARLLADDIANVQQRALPKPNGAQTFEVVGLPLERPGFYVLEAESRRLGKSLLAENRPMYVRASALVTNLSVHFKWGQAASLAWVTRLDLGTPVAQAKIAVRDCRGRLFAEAVTDRQGMALLPRDIPNPRSVEYDCPLFVSARHEDDFSFARSDWNEGIEPWRFNLPEDWSNDSRVARSLLDRTLFRPGETVHMQHILRDKRDTGLSYARTQPPTLLIEHAASQQRWFLPLTWANGAASSEWRVPSGARRGDYNLRLLNKAINPDSAAEQLEYLEGIESGAFSVGDFRVPLMRAEIDPVDKALIETREAEFDLAVRYLNGGGAKNLAVKLRAQLEPRHRIEFADFKDHDFALRGDGPDGEEESEAATLPTHLLKLDASGTGRGRISALPVRKTPHNLRVEMEYADPNGEIQTVSRAMPWWPANVVLGLKQDRWARAGQNHTLRFQAVDLSGKPAAGVPVQIRLSLRRNYAHRVRLAGGFYGYHSETRETDLPHGCNGKTDAKGRFECQAQSEQSGEVVIRARAYDEAGRIATTQHSVWVAGRDEWAFDQANHDRIDLIPEKKRYEPGETARFQVRMPYRNATALVTVEREGVLDARVVTLSGKAPLLEIPIKPGWAPNVFVSALVVRGRNTEIQPTALIDLGRPGFKLGIAAIEVGQRAHRLEVEIKTDRAAYQIREKARARIKVRTPEGGTPPNGTQVTLAAVDEGLLELAPNDSWNLLEAMLAARGYGMRTFTAQMQVTGKRHFGKKALPAGGGGGKLPTRELFDTLLFWRTNVQLDARGEAEVEIPLNDSLTAFRIVAIAASENCFGTGHTAIRSSQDLQLISGLSPVVRTGDRLQAYFSVRNGSERAMRIEVEGAVQGLPALAPHNLSLAAGEAREIAWPLRVPAGTLLEWTLNAHETGTGVDRKARDALKVKQTIQPAVPVRVQSASLHRLQQSLDLPVAAPAESTTATGKPGAEVRATLSASLADGQAGLRDYMRRYPFACLEQKTSRAVALRDRADWDAIGASLPTYLADNGLANFFPGSGNGSVALTAYLLSIADQAGWSLPLDTQTRMQNALADFVAGRLELPRNGWENALVLRLAALEALARAGKATPELIATVKPEPELWPSSALIDWIGILQRTPQLAERPRRLERALAALEARFTYTGKRLGFNQESRDDLWWMMTSADTNAPRALLALLPEDAWKERLPRLLAGMLARQRDGRWNTTTANAWGVLALERYQQTFEAVKPGGKSFVVLGKEGRVVDWQAFPKGATAFLPLAGEPATLKLRHEGEGQPYLSVTTLGAVATKAPVQRGYSVQREIIPVDQKTPGTWSRGDVLRVRLTIDARDDMGWVAVEDPVPAGASILEGSGQRGSTLLTQAERNPGKAWPAWRERLFDSYRAYYEYVPRGRFTLEYSLRLNSDGEFQMPPTRVEAMYAPEMFGEAPNNVFKVAP